MLTGTRSRRLRFTRLGLGNWRNFGSVDVVLAPRAFIVGPNASGKSNLLDAIRFLAEIARPGSGGLQAAVENRGGFASLLRLQAPARSYIDFDIHVGDRKSVV